MFLIPFAAAGILLVEATYFSGNRKLFHSSDSHPTKQLIEQRMIWLSGTQVKRMT